MNDEQKPEETKADLIKAAKGLPPTEVFSLKPRTFDEAFRFANLIAESSLIPKDFQKNPANVLIAVQLGMELGVSPMQALQNIAVVNGRPTIWGDLLPAIVYASGLMEQFDEQGDDKQASCTVKRRGFAPITRTFTMEEAKKAVAYEWENGQRRTISLADKQTYKSYPKRMLAMRARAYAMRDAFADVLKGVAVHEEVEDIPSEARDVTPAPLKTPQAITEKKEDEMARNENSGLRDSGDKSPEIREETPAGNDVPPRASKRRTITSDHNSKAASAPEQHEAPAPQAEKSQEDLINEGLMWVESCSDEDLMREPDNWLFEHLKKVQGWKNQLPVLQKFNDRRLSLANKS